MDNFGAVASTDCLFFNYTMKRIFTTMLLCCLAVAFLQAQPLTLTFTGRDASNQYFPLTRVVVNNLTKGWQETLFWPDTVLVMTPTGIGDVETFQETSLRLSQNNPNPFDGITFVNLQVAEPGDVAIEITDITGRIVETMCTSYLQPGIHEMRISLSSAGIYFLTARQNGRSASVKMVNRGNGGGNAVTVVGIVETFHETSLPHSKTFHRGATDNPFDPGDRMEYVGYAIHNGEEVESGHLTQSQYISQTIVLSFAILQGSTNFNPCPNIPTVIDIDGNIYNTVQIGSQCWMREHLRTTHFADATEIPLGTAPSNTMAFRYYPNSNPANVSEYGYVYNWPAVMNGETASNANPSNVQGICPNGWHVPSKAEWEQLFNYVGSQSEYMCGGNSNNIAKALASTTGWHNYGGACAVGNNPSSNNATGFNAMPADRYDGNWVDFGSTVYFWSSAADSDSRAWTFNLNFTRAYASGGFDNNVYNGFSVRCVKNHGLPVGEAQPCPGIPTVTDVDGNIYNTVQIGQQCWTRENLRVTHYSDGTLIPAGGDNNSDTEPYYYDYSNSGIPLEERGYLYNWTAAMHGAASSSAVPSGVQGVCPVGWHLPSDAEWTQLTDYVSSQSQYICGEYNSQVAKALASMTWWNGPNCGECSAGDQSVTANNATGFGAIPAGGSNGGGINGAGYFAIFWSSTENDRNIDYCHPGTYSYNRNKDSGFSVRCLRD